MEFFHRQTKIDFMGLRNITALFSALLFVVSISLLMVKGLNFGLDFTGGTQIELRYNTAPDVDALRDKLETLDYENAKVSNFGTPKDILVRLPNQSGKTEQELGREVYQSLVDQGDEVELRRVEFVGSEVGEHLAEQGGLAVLVALLATMLYIALRFEYRFALSAALALLHDPVLILGIFSFWQIEFDLATLAALLAVLGYSLNDTIVVYDRVRENFRKIRKASPREIMNLSINQTLSRTIMTSALTLLVVVALLLFSGETLFGFSLALLIGIVIGTYSSIFVAGALSLTLGLDKTNLFTTTKRVDDMP